MDNKKEKKKINNRKKMIKISTVSKVRKKLIIINE